ncbi:galactokinase [Nocardioides sp. GCM10027113]|uniref:galactokinase n=1 Tax=unclassified Nocardioides TaxID=2615069 RepID=UPI0036225501
MSLLDPGSPARLADTVADAFEARFGAAPTTVGRAPGRVNLIGEHTDYNRGLVLPVALPHATYAAARRRDDDRVRLASRQSPDVWEGRLADLGPDGLTGWAAYAGGVLWALREQGHDLPGLDLAIDSTVPLGAGLSSSAALECAVAVAVADLVGLDLDVTARRRVAAACMRAESEVAGAPTGGMDQTVSMLASTGTALLIDFDDDSTHDVPLPLAEDDLALLVTDTRVSHALVDGGYAERRASCEKAAAALGLGSLREASEADLDRLDDDLVRRRARHVVTEIVRVEAAVAALGSRDWNEVGRLFAASHRSMRDDFEISCDELDVAVATAVEAGAVAARMTGGGFGGSSVAVVPRDRLDAVVRAVDTAFAAEGFGAPDHLVAEPSGRAGALPR